MIRHRLKNFRLYNKCTPEQLAKVLGITVDEYNAFESGREKPTIDIIIALASFCFTDPTMTIILTRTLKTMFCAFRNFRGRKKK